MSDYTLDFGGVMQFQGFRCGRRTLATRLA
jgi:hypothetical protein